MEVATDSLITTGEADEVIRTESLAKSSYRWLLTTLVVGLVVVALTLTVMLGLSLNGARTGLDAIFPGLNQSSPTSLQVK